MLLFSLITIYNVIVIALSIISILLSVVSAVFQFYGGTSTNDKLNYRGKIAAICTVLSAMCMIIVAIITQAKETEQNRLDGIDQNKKHTDLISQYKMGNESAVKAQSEVLAKYGLMYMDANERLEKMIQDSSKNPRVIITEVTPVVKLMNDSGILIREHSTQNFKIEFNTSCEFAPVKDVKAFVYIFALKDANTSLNFLSKHQLGNKDFSMTPGQNLTSTFDVAGVFKNNQEIYILFEADYKNFEMTKGYNSRVVYMYILNHKHMYVPSDQALDEVNRLRKEL